LLFDLLTSVLNVSPVPKKHATRWSVNGFFVEDEVDVNTTIHQCLLRHCDIDLV